MKHYLKFICLIALAVGCEQSPEPEIPVPEPEPEPPIEQPSRFPPLEGTHWKLDGIVETSTGAIRELNPTNCETCYFLTFDTDSTAEGRAVINVINVFFKDGYDRMMISTKAGEWEPDATFFCDFVRKVHSCSVEYNIAPLSAGILKFFNAKQDYYLQYQLVNHEKDSNN
jgi:hypothetical protein